MPLVVNTNVMSLNAQRNLAVNTNNLSKTMEKLASGFRINRASDDAAGLSVTLRQYPCGDELLTNMLVDTNSWLMGLVTRQPALMETIGGAYTSHVRDEADYSIGLLGSHASLARQGFGEGLAGEGEWEVGWGPACRARSLSSSGEAAK